MTLDELIDALDAERNRVGGTAQVWAHIPGDRDARIPDQAAPILCVGSYPPGEGGAQIGDVFLICAG